MTVTVNQQTTYLDALLAKFETDADLQSWARTFTADATFTFRHADTPENVTLNVYDDIEQLLIMQPPVEPLHIGVSYPNSSPRNAGKTSSGTFYSFTGSIQVFGFIATSTPKKIMEFAEAILRVIYRTDTIRPFRVDSIRYVTDDPTHLAVNLALSIDWHHSVEG